MNLCLVFINMHICFKQQNTISGKYYYNYQRRNNITQVNISSHISNPALEECKNDLPNNTPCDRSKNCTFGAYAFRKYPAAIRTDPSIIIGRKVKNLFPKVSIKNAEMNKNIYKCIFKTHNCSSKFVKCWVQN